MNNNLDKFKMVKAMEFICRQINDEDIFMGWLMGGVADGDIEYGDLSIPEDLKTDEAYYYIQDDEIFQELMDCFLRMMKAAAKSGGLYCGNVVTKEG